MMLVALRCDDVKASAEFYASLGFGAGARYPYARPNDGAGQFEPAQSAGSAYLAPAANSMGVLLLPRREGRGGFFFGGGRLQDAFARELGETRAAGGRSAASTMIGAIL